MTKREKENFAKILLKACNGNPKEFCKKNSLDYSIYVKIKRFLTLEAKNAPRVEFLKQIANIAENGVTLQMLADAAIGYQYDSTKISKIFRNIIKENGNDLSKYIKDNKLKDYTIVLTLLYNNSYSDKIPLGLLQEISRTTKKYTFEDLINPAGYTYNNKKNPDFKMEKTLGSCKKKILVQDLKEILKSNELDKKMKKKLFTLKARPVRPSKRVIKAVYKTSSKSISLDTLLKEAGY